MNSKVVGCIVEIYLLKLLLGIAIYYSKVCHISGRNIEALDIMRLIKLLM